MKLDEIIACIDKTFPGISIEKLENCTPDGLLIDSNDLLKVCRLVHESEKTYFDLLSCITGIDNGHESGTMELVYNLYSIPHDYHLVLKVIIDRAIPEIETVSSVWKAAEWHEREAYDLLGITFNNHPDLRRILLPNDWEGHPLRKDYQEQSEYHSIKVKY